jgi:SAM-dependent methyltransferase
MVYGCREDGFKGTKSKGSVERPCLWNLAEQIELALTSPGHACDGTPLVQRLTLDPIVSSSANRDLGRALVVVLALLDCVDLVASLGGFMRAAFHRRGKEARARYRLPNRRCGGTRISRRSFDVVTSTFGVMFVAWPEDAARELARVCKKGGRLVICTWPPKDSERCGGSTVSSLICDEV